MAIPKFSGHNRSTSVPCISSAIDTAVEGQLRRLRASQVGVPTSSSICQSLCSIKDFYEHMNDLIYFPLNQLRRGEMEEVLEGSLGLLDACGSTLEAVAQTKESIRDLESSLRRRSYEGIHAYVISRKKIGKLVSRRLAKLGKSGKKCSLVQVEKDGNLLTIAKLLKEVEALCSLTLKSTLTYVSGPKVIQPRSWSLATVMVSSKHNDCDRHVNVNKFEKIDHALCVLLSKKSNVDMDSLLMELDALEMAIHELEDCLESVSRCLLKARVSLLNALNH